MRQKGWGEADADLGGIMGRAEKQQEGGRGARIPVLLSQPVEGVADADAAAATTVAGPSPSALQLSTAETTTGETSS